MSFENVCMVRSNTDAISNEERCILMMPLYFYRIPSSALPPYLRSTSTDETKRLLLVTGANSLLINVILSLFGA